MALFPRADENSPFFRTASHEKELVQEKNTLPIDLYLHVSYYFDV